MKLSATDQSSSLLFCISISFSLSADHLPASPYTAAASRLRRLNAASNKVKQ